MKILFLDIDGVLNNHSTTERRPDGFVGIDPLNVAVLNQFLDKNPDIKVVMSSSWREDMNWGTDDVFKYVKSQGLHADFIDITPIFSVPPNDLLQYYKLYTLWEANKPRFSDYTAQKAREGITRSVEIRLWLDNHPEVRQYAALDDLVLHIDSEKGNSIQTDAFLGVTEHSIKHLERIFNGSDNDGGNPGVG